ncbi:MAG: FCD domain-containing protein [Actinobacteria bacterium]|nr:FCD domain-containing protein [Actinomycetota bacterium]
MARRTGTAPTRSDRVLGELRADILNGRLAPGARLGFAGLGERYGVSTGVLREVLTRLVEQGLASTEAQLGFRVIEVSVDELAQLTAARVAIETMVLRDAVTHGDLGWETDVVAKHHALARGTAAADAAVATAAGDSGPGDIAEDWLAAHEAFHLALLAGCPNHYLVGYATRLRAIAEVYRCWSRPAQLRTQRDIAGEHRAIMDAAVGRDADRAVTLIEEHIRRTSELLIASQDLSPR